MKKPTLVSAKNHKGWHNFPRLKSSDYTAPTGEKYALLLIQSTEEGRPFFPVGNNNNGINLAIRSTTVSPKFVCYAEQLLDGDKNPLRGNVRSTLPVGLFDIADCNLWSDETTAAKDPMIDADYRLDFWVF